AGKASTTTAVWIIPSYRSDLQREVDLIEEIVRVFGIDQIPSSDRSRFTPLSDADRSYDFESDIRRKLVAAGLTEIRTSSLIGRNEVANARGAVQLRNPVSEDHVALRTTLLAGLLSTLARNVRAGADRIALFEIGDTFAPETGQQKLQAGLVLSGRLS